MEAQQKESHVRLHILCGRSRIVPLSALAAALLANPQDAGRMLRAGAAHLSLVFFPTAYGTVDGD